MAAPLTTLCIPPLICPSQIVDAGGGVATSLAAQAAGSVLESVGSGLAQASSWLVGQVLELILHTTEPSTGGKWFGAEMRLMERVSLLVVLPVLMVATIGAVLRQDGRRLFRIWGVGLPLALFAGLAGSQLTEWGLDCADSLTAVVIGSHAQTFGEQYTRALAGAVVSTDPLFVGIILSLLTITGAMLLWLELVVRSAGVYVATFFMPLALVGYIWPATVGMARRAIEILVSLILAKFVIVASLSLGLAALVGGGVDATVSGAAILLVAAFAPFALLRLVPVVEASAIAHLEGMSRRPARAVGRTATSAANAQTHPITQLVMSAAARRSAGSSGQGSGGLAAHPVQGQDIPMRSPDFPMPAPSGQRSGADA
jgi:hypothetical protein